MFLAFWAQNRTHRTHRTQAFNFNNLARGALKRPDTGGTNAMDAGLLAFAAMRYAVIKNTPIKRAIQPEGGIACADVRVQPTCRLIATAEAWKGRVASADHSSPALIAIVKGSSRVGHSSTSGLSQS